MAVSPKCKDTLLHFFHHFKAHTLPFSVRFQHKYHFIQELFYEDCDHCMEFSDNPNLLKNFRRRFPIKTENTWWTLTINLWLFFCCTFWLL